MLGFFSLFKDNQNVVKKDQIFFVSIPDKLSENEIKERFSSIARSFAEFCDENHVFLNYGKDDFIEYDYTV